ncbi:MAG: HD domain-containing protein [Syntrophomonadaceae bacterium]|nr:HD domain-containing protein [Syntrophomonadaceae bacterium]
MKRIDLLLQDSLYNEYLHRNAREEMDQRLCRHDINHHFTVAQMTFSLMLNNNDWEIFLEETGIDSQAAAKEVVYAAGLLHDIGKWKEYRDGEDLAACSARLSRTILPRALFTPDEIEIICRAICEQRNINKDISLLGEKLYRGNNLSRMCSECHHNEECPRAGNQEISTGAAEY